MVLIKSIFKAILSNLVLVIVSGLFGLVGITLIGTSEINTDVYSERVLSYDVDSGYYVDDEGDDMYSPIFYYEVDGVQYECRSSISTSSEVSEDNIFVYYNPENHSQCTTEWHASSGASMGVFMFIFSLIPLVILVINCKSIYKTEKLTAHLKKNGVLLKNQKYTLKYTGTDEDGEMMGIPIVSMRYNGLEYIFASKEPIYDDKPENEKLIDVLYDPSDLTKFIVDFNINIEKL